MDGHSQTTVSNPIWAVPLCSSLSPLLKPIAAALACFLLWGCAGASVAVVSSELPVPLLEPMELNVGIQLSDELLAFEHSEDLKKQGKWRIELGSAQPLMFDNLASGMFRDHEIINGNARPVGAIDALLVPSIKELQFAIPNQTKGDFFEVWIQYEFQLLAPDGAQIAQFPLTAYGKANRRDFGLLEDTENGALGLAAKVALRDAMAFFALRFKRIPEVAAWLQTRTVPLSPTGDPGTTTQPASSQPNQPAGNTALPAPTQAAGAPSS